mmetsp:Transcript_55885/g.127010  ORF Transcript_55885/g.127010 Transcript_55885/m.127010 type:complete len:122 (+) Transcript_55885:471-836(+)
MACLACEKNALNEFIVCERSDKGLSCCCCEFGNACKCSFCPVPLTIYGSQGQRCCCFSRCSFPCNDLTPFELGFCGIMCINKIDRIADAEAALREKMAVEKDVVEATVVEKGGAPMEVMLR